MNCVWVLRVLFEAGNCRATYFFHDRLIMALLKLGGMKLTLLACNHTFPRLLYSRGLIEASKVVRPWRRFFSRAVSVR